jgi:hypothetical protein
MFNELDYDSKEEWLMACLKDGFCPVCETESACDHMIANIDATYGSVDAGSLRVEVQTGISECMEEEGSQREAVQGEIEYLMRYADMHLSSEFCGDRPGGDSEDYWFWAKDVERIRKLYTERGK